MVENDVLETKTKKKERDIRSHLLALFSMSLSRLRNSSMAESILEKKQNYIEFLAMPGTLMAPHPMLLMKSTGLVMFGAVGNLRFLIINQFPPRTTHLRRKSSSRGLISSFINKIWKAIWAVKISLSHSNKPLRGGRFFF